MTWLRQLGQTGIEVSAVGLGTVKFGRNQGMKYPQDYALPEDKTIQNLLAMARDYQINLLDTAPAYGCSEQRLGKLLTGPRHDWVIVSKAGEIFDGKHSQFDFSADHIKMSVERSLKRLKTDYLDVLLIHSSGDDRHIIEQDHVFSTLADLKKRGLIRAGGMSTKTIEGGLATVDQSDVAMITYHPGYQDEEVIIDQAQQQQKGILVKKGFASGHLQKLSKQEDPITTAMRFVLGHAGVSSLIAGTINPEHLKQNIVTARTIGNN